MRKDTYACRVTVGTDPGASVSTVEVGARSTCVKASEIVRQALIACGYAWHVGEAGFLGDLLRKAGQPDVKIAVSVIG